jgi:hypothetical protein
VEVCMWVGVLEGVVVGWRRCGCGVVVWMGVEVLCNVCEGCGRGRVRAMRVGTPCVAAWRRGVRWKVLVGGQFKTGAEQQRLRNGRG